MTDKLEKHMTYWFTGLCLLTVAACSAVRPGQPAPAIAAAERLPLEICEIEGINEPLLCGTYRVAENRSDPESYLIDIAVLVIPAANGNPDGLAWTEHPGGPGRTTLGSASFFTNTEVGQAFRSNRDIVLVDQRGAGQSGGLYCDAMRDLPILQPYYTERKVTECRREMVGRGYDLSGYSTLAAIEDLEHIRQWLGYAKFDVAGWSYGSRFMLTYANRYPDSIRTMMLAVPTVFDYRRPLDWARLTENAMNGLFSDCQAESACNEAFPDLRQDFQALLAQLEREPVTVEFFNPITRRQDTASVDRSRLVEEVHAALLRVQSARMIPLVIHEAARGNFEPFVDLAVPDRAPRPIAEAQYLSIVCPEETALFTIEEAEAEAEGTFTGMFYVDEFKMACEAWGLPPHPEYPLQWIERDVPTLVISGDRDPITPVEYGRRIAASMSNARHLEVHRMPHDFSGLEGSQCLEKIILQFLDSMAPGELDASCIEDMRAPPFQLELPAE